MRLVYRTLSLLLAPFWLLFLAIQQRGNFRFLERLGFYESREDAPIWIQAVSVGEVRIALRLAAVLKSRGLPVALTSTTATGLDLAAKEGPPDLSPQAFPVDLPGCARRAVKRLSPRALVLVETEIWPTLFREARTSSVPVFIVNARLSDRSFRRTQKFRRLYEKALRDVFVAAQSEEHAARFHILGASSERIVVLGNLKYDLRPPEAFEEVRASLARGIPEAPLWVAGSVREGEEILVLEAHAAVKASFPGARLILAPRHLNRVQVCLEQCEKLGLRGVERTAGPGPDWDVLILDTVGELWSAYALGTAAFVGGSLVPLGGQNVLEPAFLGKPVLFGPHTENFREDAERLLAGSGAARVEDPRTLAEHVAAFLSEPTQAEACGKKALAAVEAHKGAVDRTAKWIADTIPGV